MRFGDDNDCGLGPGVNAHLQGLPKDECEVIGARLKAPFEQEVGDARGSQSGLVRCAGKGSRDLQGHDQVKQSCRQTRKVGKVGEVKGQEVKEPCFEDAGHGCRLGSNSCPVEDRGNGRAVVAMTPFGQVP